MTPTLTKAQLTELRNELEQELARLRRTIVSTENDSSPVALDPSSVDRASGMDAVEIQETARAVHEREQVQETRIVDALQRLDDGSYGVCDSCGERIPYGRLLVMPEARTCATCGGA